MSRTRADARWITGTSRAGIVAAALMVTTCAWSAASNDKADYDRRSAARYTALFQSLDRNTDGVVTQAEAHGDLNFGPRFDDMDINRDGVVTAQELQRFIGQQHGTVPETGHRP